MISVTNTSIILKEVYLSVLARQINLKTNAFYNKIEMNSNNIQGSAAIIPVQYGISGGISTPNETDDLPQPASNRYTKFCASLRNIYGTFEISDKIIRSTSSPEAMINVLNNEMESLLKSAKFNFARMLFQDGRGILCRVGDMTGLPNNHIRVDSVKNIVEGMTIDVIDCINGEKKVEKKTIQSINRQTKVIRISLLPNPQDLNENDILTIQDSYQTEILGIPYIFCEEALTIYNTLRQGNDFLWPTMKSGQLSTDKMQEIIDDIEEASGGGIDMIICSYDARRAYFEHLKDTRTNIDYMNLDGGFKALSYNGIPVVTERFVPNNSMYFINTEDYTLQQLNDWDWLETSGGKILRQIDKKAAYSATLVKYANLICKRPIGQGLLTITD